MPHTVRRGTGDARQCVSKLIRACQKLRHSKRRCVSDLLRGLKAGDESLNNLQAVSEVLQEDVDKITPLMERAEKNAGTVMGQQKILTQVGSALRTINRQSSYLLEIAETVSSLSLEAYRYRPSGVIDGHTEPRPVAVGAPGARRSRPSAPTAYDVIVLPR